jgi:Domain of unknown function (DUF4124)
VPERRIAGGRGLIFATLAILVCGLAGEVTAEIYTWVDREGQVHFTDNYAIVPPDYRDRVQSRPSSPPSALPPPPAPAEIPKKEKLSKSPPSPGRTARGPARVVAVLDGDTIVIDSGEKVRYAGLFTISPTGILPSIVNGTSGIHVTRIFRASRAVRFSVWSKR